MLQGPVFLYGDFVLQLTGKLVLCLDMGPGPGADFRVVGINKGDLQMIRPCDPFDQREQALLRFFRCGTESNGTGRSFRLDIRPEAFQGLLQLIHTLGAKLFKGKDLQAGEKRIAFIPGKMGSAKLDIYGLKTVQQCEKGPFFIHGPDMLRFKAHALLQLLIGTGLGKADLIQAAAGIKLQKLKIALRFRIFTVNGKDPGDSAGNGGGIVAFQNADAFVPLHDVKPAHVFTAANGIADAFIPQMRIAESDPFHGKLGIRRQKGHEVAGKRGTSPCRAGADNELGGDIHQTQLHLPGRLILRQQFIQNGGIGIIAPAHGGFIVFLAQLQCLGILGDGFLMTHCCSPFGSSSLVYCMQNVGEINGKAAQKISRSAAASGYC